MRPPRHFAALQESWLMQEARSAVRLAYSWKPGGYMFRFATESVERFERAAESSGDKLEYLRSVHKNLINDSAKSLAMAELLERRINDLTVDVTS